MLGIMAVVLCGIFCWVVCCAACWIQRYDVQHDDVLVGILDNGCIGQHDVVICGMLCWAVCITASCVERYALQQVVFSGMLEVRQHDALVGILGIMLRWAAWWAVCWVDWTAWLAEFWGSSVMCWAAWWVTGCLGQHVVQHEAGQHIVLGGLLGSFMNNIPLDDWTTWAITRLTSQIYWANLKQNEAKGENISEKR